MNLKFHLYSSNAQCSHCIHNYHKMDMNKTGPGYCAIISTTVENDYYCDFYQIKHLKQLNIKKL